MNKLYDEISGVIDPAASFISTSDIELINSLENGPLHPVGIDDIYVRKCRLTGDGINCHFGRFRSGDLEKLLQKVQGVSCLIGHRKETVGVARFFGGKIEKHSARDTESGEMVEMSFIVPKIYWMKSHSQAEDLKTNIDGGIYHQASISWYYNRPVCCLCENDIRKCDHVPGKRYDGKLCYFWYDEIGDVLEGSIVYAGGHPGTGFELNRSRKDSYRSQQSVFKIGTDGRISREDILPFIENVEPGSVFFTGDIEKQGWTDDKIGILHDEESIHDISKRVPPYLCEKLELYSNTDLSDQNAGTVQALSGNESKNTKVSCRDSGIKNSDQQIETGTGYYKMMRDEDTELINIKINSRGQLLNLGLGTAIENDLYSGKWCPVDMRWESNISEHDLVNHHSGECVILDFSDSRITAVLAGENTRGIFDLKRLDSKKKTRWYIHRKQG